MSNVKIIYKDNDSLIEIDELRNEATGDFINNATISVTVKDSAGNNVTGAVALPMQYLLNSDGRYRATLLNTLALVVNARYTAEISVNAGTGLVAKRVVECVCRTRT